MTTVFRNGSFFVGTKEAERDHHPFADCVIVSDSVIEYVGDERGPVVEKAIKNAALVLDMQSRVMVPGFIDGHLHFLLFGLSLQKLDIGDCKNIDDIQGTIKSHAIANPRPPRMLCQGWKQSTTNRMALASMLDSIDDERPIYIDAEDLHSTWCNSAALEELDRNKLPDPAGGKIHRDENGKASGLLSEAAASTIVWPHLIKELTLEDKVAALEEASKAYTRAGYTGMVEMAMEETAWEALQLLHTQEKFNFRVAAHWLIRPSEDEVCCLEQVDRAIDLHQRYNTETSPNLRITGIKVICDGVVDSCTAALSRPYTSTGTFTAPFWAPNRLAKVVQKAESANLQVALHAIGDAAIKMAIDALETHGTPGRRHRIEHLELASPKDAARLGGAGITASIQPVHSDPSIVHAWPELIGADRCKYTFPYKSLRDGGAVLALGTDAPTAPYAPMPNMYCATTRRSAREPELKEKTNEQYAISLVEAMAAATEGAAYSCFAEGYCGKLESGMKADFAVIDMEWDAEKLLKAKVCQTWFEGKKVFDRDEEDGHPNGSEANVD